MHTKAKLCCGARHGRSGCPAHVGHATCSGTRLPAGARDRLRWLAAVLVVLVVVPTSLPAATGQPYRPSIAVLTQSSIWVWGQNNTDYLAQSYVQFIEMSGGIVVPVHAARYAHDPAGLFDIFSQVNGVLIPGGALSLQGTPYLTVAGYLHGWAQQANALRMWTAEHPAEPVAHAPTELRVPAGLEDANAAEPQRYTIQPDYFPILGVCLGFEALVSLAAGTTEILSTGYDAHMLVLPLRFDPIVLSGSRLFADALAIPGAPEPTVAHIFGTQPVTINNHGKGVAPTAFLGSPALANWSLLTTNTDRKGRPFVSTIEHTVYPFYATQWHPEKAIFLWNGIVPHSDGSIRANGYISRFFLGEARRSTHAYRSLDALRDAWIYSHIPVDVTDRSETFMRSYFWNNT